MTIADLRFFEKFFQNFSLVSSQDDLQLVKNLKSLQI